MIELAQVVERLGGRRVLVVGDISLDEYLYGTATRLSREAPIPVLELLRREAILGGAANPARNIIALGSAARLVGIVGDDIEGQQVREALAIAGIDGQWVVTSPSRATTRKTRILADESPRLPQQVARLDRLERAALSPGEEQQVLEAIVRAADDVEAILCSDYQLGLLSPLVVDTIRELCQQRNLLFTVDAQGNAHYYRQADLFRCNDKEAAAVLGHSLHNEADFQAGLAALREQLGAKLVIVTRGPQGLSLLGQGISYTHIPAAQISEVYDTIGAGDTFIAVTTLGLIGGLDGVAAAQLANIAAGQVVRRVGNAVVTQEELRQAIKTP
jgi:D-glycero-beta-D-manno-heptose-7-phosphate kinase